MSNGRRFLRATTARSPRGVSRNKDRVGSLPTPPCLKVRVQADETSRRHQFPSSRLDDEAPRFPEDGIGHSLLRLQRFARYGRRGDGPLSVLLVWSFVQQASPRESTKCNVSFQRQYGTIHRDSTKSLVRSCPVPPVRVRFFHAKPGRPPPSRWSSLAMLAPASRRLS